MDTVQESAVGVAAEPPRRPTLAAQSSPFLASLWFSLGPFVALITVWWVLVTLWNPGAGILPSPKDVATELIRTLRNGLLLDYAGRSMARLLLTAGIVIPAGIALGMLVGMVGSASRMLMPVFRYLTAIPAIAWLPILLVTIGFNQTSIVATAAYGFFFPVLFNTLVGVQTVPILLRSAVRTLGGSSFRIVRDVLVPGSLPSVAAGIRLGFGYGWRALIAAEMLVAAGGLGHLLFKAESVGLAPRMMAGMVAIGVLATAVDYFLLEPLEHATIRRWGTVHR